MTYRDLHIHTCFCDGKDTPEDMVLSAIRKGLTTIGFSAHSYTAFDDSFCMSPEGTLRYREEIGALKQKYAGQIEILCGVERDYFSADTYSYDYVIGSLHYVKKDGIMLSVDESEEVFVKNVTQYFGGDYMAFVRCYYQTIADIVPRTQADIVGHFDLITKFNEGNKYFDENSAEYRAIATEALNAVAASHPLFELNTGAISRGYRSMPYPAPFLLEQIRRSGCQIILSSDAHAAKNIAFYFPEAEALLASLTR